MTKGEVVDLLSIGRTDVVAGNQLPAMASSIIHSGHAREDFTRFVEVWRLPARTTGTTSYVYLAFDKTQCLDAWGVSEFMFGFPADRGVNGR